MLRSGATGETVRAAGNVIDGGRELVDTVRYHLRDIMSPHFLGALFHSDEKDGTLLRATNAMRAASLWDSNPHPNPNPNPNPNPSPNPNQAGRHPHHAFLP